MAPTQRELAADRREVKLAEIREQVVGGRLSIRQMTAEERTRYGTDAHAARPPRPKRAKRWSS